MKKYVKLMADYCSDGVWGHDGIMLNRDRLPISDALKEEIGSWVGYYDRNCQDYLPRRDRTKPFDTKWFNSEGERITEALEAELPGWTVVFRPEEL